MFGFMMCVGCCATVDGENITSQIKRFYTQLDKSIACDDAISRYSLLGDTVSRNANSIKPDFDFRAYKPLVLLKLDYDRTKKISPTSSLYDAMQLDTLHFEIAFLDKNDLLVATLQLSPHNSSILELNPTSTGGKPSFIADEGFPKDTLTTKNINDRAISIRDILRLQPDVILTYNQLAQTFLFLKANKIYVYRIQFHDSFELDRYVDIVIRGKK